MRLIPRRSDRSITVLEYFPAVVALAFLAVVVSRFGLLRSSIYDNADLASAPVFAETLSHPVAGRTIVLGDSPWYEPLWLLRGTSWLPSHFTVWEVLPFLWWALAVGLVFAIVRRATHRRSTALVATALIACPGLGMRSVLWVPNSHGAAIAHILLLLLALVVVLQNRRWIEGVRGWVALLLVAAVTILGATDQLVVLFGLVPLLVATGLTWRRTGDVRPLVFAAMLTVISGIGGMLLVSLGEHAGIRATGRVFKFVELGQLPRQLLQLPEAVMQLADRTVLNTPLGVTNGIYLVAGLVAFAGIVALVRVGVRLIAATASPMLRDHPPIAEASPARTSAAADDPRLVGDAVAVFATAAALIGVAVWLLTELAFDLGAVRYIAPAYVLACAAIPVLAAREGWRMLVAAGALLIVVAATHQFRAAPTVASPQGAPTERNAAAIGAFAAKYGVKRGYGAYWSSSPITWHTRFRLRIAPVLPCGPHNCRYFLGTSSDWYTPQGGRTMLVTDSVTPNQPLIDPAYGKPIAVLEEGTFTARIYDRDIMAAIG